ncbi:TIM-barrel domain-containing protein [Bacteroides xylanisolvens]|uniref:TIM-barrel domain-containing protein n=1 Tax=Bacteroides TaxID=816 RepID=UPI001CE46A47|nr:MULTISPECIES: TIM-barrel domain-containing protein [Bacteroides]
MRTISDQYMIGSDLMVTPLYENKKSRKVYFPEGVWYNLNTNEKYRVMVTS